ncbi:acyltransferase [Labedella populi]|uniref:Acyltransferase n=1 Tax=Labedella populi TaxID=2498850 RepID=A0A3S3ZZP5_9MICO|nr:acyltransferase family protein [Labedella populi]RWZ68533.1 acyltransferase [Labedella populi]
MSGSRRVEGGRREPDGFRPEIQALRAVAVLAVVVYHLWPARLPGGYAGVDVFFVISGFLITAHLVKEAERSGRIRLPSFYARRARRLLPAALVVLLATAIGTAIVLPLQNWPQVVGEILAATFYVENWVLAADSVDYLAQNANIASPVQHFWSLSVEEQFYLVWPLLVIAALVLVRRRGHGPVRRILVFLFGAVAVASLLHSVVLTTVDPGPAYFATTTRAWEFAAGGLLALVPAARRLPAAVRVGSSWLGLVLIVLTLVTFTELTPFPGWAALLPVIGTLLVIAAGASGGLLGTARLFRLRPVQALGSISYSLYLWHWPIVVLAAAAVDGELSTPARLGLLALSLLLGWLTKLLVEDPARTWAVLAGARPRRTLAATSLALVPVVVASLAVGGTASARIATEEARVVAAVNGDIDCFGAAALIDAGCDADAAPAGDLVPSTIAAPSDDVNTPECWSRNGEAELKVCSFGPDAAQAEVRIALVGDSHSNQYLSAVQWLAEERGWAVDVIGKTGCIWTAASQDNDPAWLANCAEWKRSLDTYLRGDVEYDAVVTSASAESPIAPEGEDLATATVRGFVEAWAPVADRGTVIVAIRDNPHTRGDYLECIADDPASAAARCAVPIDDAFPFFDGLPGAVERTPGATLVDFTPYFCDGDVCPPVIGGSIVYRDPGHLTSTYARTLAPLLGDAIQQAIGS